MKYTSLVTRVPASVASCLFLLAAQVPVKRNVDVTVTDPRGRIVTGLERAHFEIIENGVPRAITAFTDGSAPISIAIVANEAFPDVGTLGAGDELIQTPSVSNALRQLAASKNSRRVLVVTEATAATAAPQEVPAGIEVAQVNSADLVKAVTSLRNQYRLEFDSAGPSATVEVAIKQPVGLPRLTLNRK